MIRVSTVVIGSYSARVLLTSGMLQVTAGLRQLLGAGNRVHYCKVYTKNKGSGPKTFEVELTFRGPYPECGNALTGMLWTSMTKKACCLCRKEELLQLRGWWQRLCAGALEVLPGRKPAASWLYHPVSCWFDILKSALSPAQHLLLHVEELCPVVGLLLWEWQLEQVQQRSAASWG